MFTTTTNPIPYTTLDDAKAEGLTLSEWLARIDEYEAHERVIQSQRATRFFILSMTCATLATITILLLGSPPV